MPSIISVVSFFLTDFFFLDLIVLYLFKFKPSSIPVNSSRLFFADLRPFKPPALAVLVYFFFQCVICINNKVNKEMRVRMTTITMIYYNTEKKSTIPWGKLTSFLKKLHTVTVTPQQDNHFRKQIVYLKMSLCILVKDKVSTPHIVVITAHCHKGYKLLTGRSMVWWITRALQEYCLLLFFCFVFLFFCCFFP